MYLPDINIVYAIASLDCQFYLGKDNRWMMIGELEQFEPDLCVELIVNMSQEDGVEIIVEDERKIPAIMC